MYRTIVNSQTTGHKRILHRTLLIRWWERERVLFLLVVNGFFCGGFKTVTIILFL